METKNQDMKNQIMYIAAVVATTIFISAAYFLPKDAFFSVFAAGLFLIPASFFIYLVHKVSGT
jgi:hypothetical protein